MSSFLKAKDEIWISRQVIKEYIVTMTHLAITGGFITLEQILENVRIFSARFKVADETKENNK